MQLCVDYLAERGITDETVRLHGLELDDRLNHTTVKRRLGQHLPKGTIETVWFPLSDPAGNVSYIARPLPTIANHPKFLCPIGSGGLPFVPASVYQLAYSLSVVITEGPVKALACVQAGIAAIGLNGVWGAAAKNSRDLYVIRSDLQSALDWRGRKVYIGFDVDCAINPDVRQALIRLFFILSTVGAQVYQLTSWRVDQGKGIDDFLVGQLRSNSQHDQKDVLGNLLGAAKPFIDTIEPTPLDLALVRAELLKVEMPDLLRGQLARPLAKRLGIHVDEIEKISKASRRDADFVDPDPWPQPILYDELLHDLSALIKKHISVEDHGKVAIALWIVLTYLVEHVDVMPILAITSPEKRCGKTRLLTLLLKLVRRPIPGVSLSAATVYRSIEKWHPTLLIDEADGILKDTRGHDNLELRSVVNSGHTRELAYVNRCVGDSHDVQKFSTWGPKAIALIGKMPDSMADRSIHIRLMRKPKGEKIARIRETPEAEFEEFRSKIIRLVQDHGGQIGKLFPNIPTGLNDRAEDSWLPLLGIAEVVGGDWPTLASKAAVALSSDGDDADNFATKLLRALKEDYEKEGKTELDGFQATSDICDHLNNDKEAPWANFKKGITPEFLAVKLRAYKVKSERPTVSGTQQRGFFWKKLQTVFDRYL